MDVTLLIRDFEEKLKIASSITGRGPTPILDAVLIETRQDKVLLTASDGVNATVFAWCAANTKAAGIVAVNGRDLHKYISTLKTGSVRLFIEGDHLHMESGMSQATFLRLPEQSYPRVGLPQFSDTTLKSATLLAAIESVIPATDEKNDNPLMGSVYFETNGKVISFVATDGKRLSLVRIPGDLPEVHMIIPVRGLDLVRKILKTEETAMTMPDMSSLAFTPLGGDFIVRLQLLTNLNYLAYEGLFPTKVDFQAALNMDEFVTISKRALVFSDSYALYGFGDGALRVQAENPSRGSSVDEMPAQITVGNNTEFYLSMRHVVDFLRVAKVSRLLFTSGCVAIGGNNQRVVLLKPDLGNGTEFLHIMAPFVRS